MSVFNGSFPVLLLDGHHAISECIDNSLSCGFSPNDPTQHSFDDASLVEIPLDTPSLYSRPQKIRSSIISTIY